MRFTGMLVALALLATTSLQAQVFNGVAEYETDALGYYYAMTGGLFPTGTTPNGDNASGGVLRYITDTSVWGGYTLGTWHRDDWFTQNSGLALTLQNDGATVYDNNGIEDNSYGDFYTEGSTNNAGLYRGYSMSNNFDWIYSGYFKLEQETTFNRIIGYFDAVSGFDPGNPALRYAMNVWSNEVPTEGKDAGYNMPVNTGSFMGDVFSSYTSGGTFSWSMTGASRTFTTGLGYYDPGYQDPIWRLSYELETPVTLDQGIYWFSHDAQVTPEPASLLLLGTGLLGVAWVRRRRRGEDLA